MLSLRQIKRKISFSIKSNRPRPVGLQNKLKPFKQVKIFTFLAVLLLLIYCLLKADLFSVKRVKISFSGLNFDTTEIASFTTKYFVGKSIILLNKGAFEDVLLQKYTVVKAATIKRNFPGLLDVKIVAREPVGVVLNLGGEVEASASSFINLASQKSVAKNSWFVDSGGLIFAENKLEGTDLPEIYIDSKELHNGLLLKDSPEIFLLDIILNTQDLENRVNLVSQIGIDVIAVLKDNTYLLFSMDKSVVSQVDIAKKVLEKYKIEAKKLVKIDLRFKNPVVEFR